MEFEKSYVVFDVEATIRCPVGTTKANPHWPSNEMICAAWRYDGVTESAYNVTGLKHNPSNCVFSKKKIIVGHNLPFDLMWVKRVSDNTVDFSGHTLWDTALAEYVLTAQEARFPSLDELCDKYGLPKKDDRIKKMWDAGIDTNNIPRELLVPYCCADVENTEKIFLHQLQEAKKTGTLKLILVLNDALLAITEMMWNGMKVDSKNLAVFTLFNEGRLAGIEARFKNRVSTNEGYDNINLSSPKQLSALLYGGSIEYTTKELDGAYKSGLKTGLPRYKTIRHVKKFPGICTADPKDLGIEKTEYGWSTSEDALLRLKTVVKHDYIKDIEAHREIDKQLNTYFRKTKELLFPKDFIYHNINATATVTGRYSSSEPNLQNITRGEKSDIKKCYISRFEQGELINLDFRQLEMVALAHLSRDADLSADIAAGVDIHRELYYSVYGRYPTTEERTQFKRASFALIYGAGPRKISKITGMSEQEAKRFILAWANRYPDTARWWEVQGDNVEYNRQPSGLKSPNGIPLGVAIMHQPTGRLLRYVESCPEWAPTHPAFSPNDYKNYPVQSFATGDLVPLFLGKLARALLSSELKDKALLVNTVHDSVVLDCEYGYTEQAIQVLKNVSADMHKFIKEELGIEMSIPLNVEISRGENWSDQREVN